MRMTEKGPNGYYVPADRGTFGVEVDQYRRVEGTRFTGTVVERLGEYEQSGYEPTEFDHLCREMSNLRMKLGCKTYEQMKEHYVDVMTKYQELLYDLCFDDDGSQVVALDEIIALASAKKKGVCRVLPCKVGDVVWVIDTSHNRIRAQKVTSVHYWENDYQEDNHGFVETAYISEGGECAKRKRKFSDLGKTWFTSKEEAFKHFGGKNNGKEEVS